MKMILNFPLAQRLVKAVPRPARCKMQPGMLRKTIRLAYRARGALFWGVAALSFGLNPQPHVSKMRDA